ncbi:MAG: DUF3419 family protein [Clostridia bacterium]|nr:DUF3419 family protein [Clostridia bacterium]
MGYKDDKPHKEHNEALELFAYNGNGETLELMPSANNSSKKVFGFSNENITQLFGGVDFSGKKVALTGSSGDSLFQLLLQGARDFTIIDDNPMAQAFIELKMAAFENLDMSEHYAYMSRDEIFNPHIYRKLSHSLSERSREFWDNLMLDVDNTDVEQKIEMADMLSQGCFTPRGKDFRSYYESKANYAKIKEALKNCNIRFLRAEYSDFTRVLKDEKFDLIRLSNIFDYVDVDEFFSKMTQLGHNNLTQDGFMQVYYVFQNDQSFLESFLTAFQSYFGTRKTGEYLNIKNIDGISVDKKFADRFFKGCASGIFMTKEAFDRIPENFESAPYSEL